MKQAELTKIVAELIAAVIFIFGLLVLFLTGAWWPGFLFVLGTVSLAWSSVEERRWLNIQGAVWLYGLGTIFWAGFSLPLALILVGSSMVLAYLFRPPFMQENEEIDEPGEPVHTAGG